MVQWFKTPSFYGRAHQFDSWLGKRSCKLCRVAKKKKKIPEAIKRVEIRVKLGRGVGLSPERMGRHLSQSLSFAITKYHRLRSL